jgi:hypothetical protein
MKAKPQQRNLDPKLQKQKILNALTKVSNNTSKTVSSITSISVL